MTFFQNWQNLIIPVTVTIVSQFIKILLESHKYGFKWSHLNNYGGMPSSHSAGFTSLAVTIGLTTGFYSPLFAMTLFVALAFIRDAVGIRWSLGKHGQVLNHLLVKLPQVERAQLPHRLKDRLGHTYPEALAGIILGIILTAIFYTLING
ncbi:MAG: hypothetical protein A2233_05300 [Candidatus Kerfeldbacteria bacterium RIFOXYA2_FULL_38_24]|uniref:Acid phosphatase n=1 Tax=Candidatus Kerfeldbacteria bacterium RIFOXYB2_FULL_38_14 TaxID=1798547 RepID=A0A1G2BHU4_9BACT|nr:MAG: hypothetical protein A2233_05300 [Candidatus Kerfeldbacteria bacterium RIFOXYA2_FULL_38_24]OGY88246.1 MAG: hypothetical protein A2319_03595 [Candidatus Kerfeldbacteria bacterium RIFOXYB2_FULL_38_14]OGY89441.1 MAG: hypothetical protein A2458_00650 [Candidatus Kerfeldbacteria bacterium RIFOXYC2_FULL_38_9]